MTVSPPGSEDHDQNKDVEKALLQQSPHDSNVDKKEQLARSVLPST